jgi:SAM-dependent methyltransferase
MGLLKKIFNQTKKPEGFLGKMMLRGMNSGHARMADWGMSFLRDVSPSEIVELGCGGGRNAGKLLKMYPEARLTAIDFSPLCVEMTRRYNKAMIDAGRCVVQEGDVSNLLLEEGKYDLATAFETVYFWPGLEHCFAEVAKVLKPGGVFMIVNESDGVDPATVKFEKIIDGMKCYTPERIEVALKAAGFEISQSARHRSKPWITIVAKKIRVGK